MHQILAKMDGLVGLQNLLVVGMTNRRDLLDSALLRPGRFEVSVYIPTPNHIGRIQILNIHMGQARENNLLDNGKSTLRIVISTMKAKMSLGFTLHV